MQLQELNSGLIYTGEECIGCSKCISGCVVVGANVVVKEKDTDSHRVMVDPNKCILCGECLKACMHNARNYRDDTEIFFDALKNGEEISILVAPSLQINYEKQYHNILGYLKHMGVRRIYNVSFGAEIMTWVYMNFIRNFGLKGVIAQSCPVIVDYLEKYKPQLLQYLMPVQSPLMCTAIYLTDYLKVTDRLAFISPCVAKKKEIDDIDTYGKVSYNVTFERLMEHLEKEDITGYYADEEGEYGIGALIPMAGGLSNNIKPYVGQDEVLIQTSGSRNIFPYFDEYYDEVMDNRELPFLVDALNCTNGCNFGPATNCGAELRNRMTFSAHRLAKKADISNSPFASADYKKRLKMLNARFEKFELSSFVRQYDLTRGIKEVVLSEEETESIYQSMFKYTEEQRHTDCGSCGYKTCREMVHAVGTNINYIENCISYSKECIRRETEKTTHLLNEISAMNEELKESAQLKSNFLANMSHEIRTPMNAVIGMAEMALRGNIPDEERGYINQIKSSGRSLLAIINDILDFSKLESGKMEIHETEYEVMSLINDTANIVMTRIGEKEITLVVEVDPEIPYILFGDDIRIKQVLVNLANNAVKFTPSGAVKISMRFERAQDNINLTIEVKDTGIGIKEKDIQKLFNSFQQVDSKRNRNIEGTGLGLAISKEIVTLMGGEIEVASIYGEGSTFSFSIPQKIIEDIPSVSLKTEGTLHTASLIANHFVREGFAAAISKLPVENIECSTLEELEAAAESGAESVFLDYPVWNEKAEALAKSFGSSPEGTQMVVIIDPRKDLISSPYIRKLNQPVYCLNVAAALNRESAPQFENHDGVEEIRFEAPDAHILIVDDNSINLTVGKGILSPLHMDITTASGAKEAIKLIQENRYDIVFMDHMMPDIDGVEATHMIRGIKGDYYKNLPIIALTANAVSEAREMFLREGMSDFVAKPIEIRDVMVKIRKWLPEDKIKDVKMAAGEEKPGEQEELKLDGIDVEAGIALSGNIEVYKKILTDYYEVIEKKADLIEHYKNTGDIKAYTIEVHALKSASKLIGAAELSEKAAWLEKCGHDENLAPIEAETEELLRKYRSYIPVLAPFAKINVVSEKHEISEQELAGKLETLVEALDDFDIDLAGAILEELRSCSFSEEGAEYFSRLSENVDELEYDDAAGTAKTWIEDLS